MPHISVCEIIGRALTLEAYCIHVEPHAGKGRIRYRADGRLVETADVDHDMLLTLMAEIVERSNLFGTKVRPADGLMELSIDSVACRIHVSAVPSSHGPTAVLKILDDCDPPVAELSDLGLSQSDEQQVKRILDKRGRLILITGPAGSGLSKSQYAMLNYLRDPQRRISTVEDYVDSKLDGIQQCVVDEKGRISVADLTRRVARLHPDVLMVAELRSFETAEAALLAANQRCLVIGGLHTLDAASALTRLIDMGLPPALVASNVTAVLGQRLVRRICESCKTFYDATKAEKMYMNIESGQLAYGAGCSDCRYTGFKGRTGVFEVLVVSDELRKLVADVSPTREIRRVAIGQGMTPFWQSGIDKVRQGQTTIGEVYRVVPRRE